MIYESVRKMTQREQMGYDLGYSVAKAEVQSEIDRLTAELAAMKRERDAAVATIVYMSDLAGLCFGCKYDGGEEHGCQHPKQSERCEEHHYAWRGVQAHDGAEGA